MSSTVYIHYGSDEYKTPNPIKNSRYLFTKPKGGLWASRKNDLMGWKNWCEREEFNLNQFEYSFEFKLRDEANILVLSDPDQLLGLPNLNPIDEPYVPNRGIPSECYLDFEKLALEYDAIEVVNISKLYWPLYGWDCNSILIMNPAIIELLSKL